jgi:hypothetical protein
MFKFTIRELLLLTVIVAMGVGWWVDRGRLAEELEFIKDPYTAEGYWTRESELMPNDSAPVSNRPSSPNSAHRF